MKNSLNYSDVNTVDMLTTFPTTRKSWLSEYDIRVEFLKLKIFLVPQYRHIIHLFEVVYCRVWITSFGAVFTELSRVKDSSTFEKKWTLAFFL